MLADRPLVPWELVQLPHPRAERMHTRSRERDQLAGTLGERPPALAQHVRHLDDRIRVGRHDLKLRRGQLELEPRIPVEHVEHFAGAGH